MPQMQSITAGGVTFDALTPSSGDTVPARWRVANAPSPIGMPTAQVTSRYNGPKTARRVDFEFVQPYYTLDASAGNKLTLHHKVLISTTVLIPEGIPTIYADEAVDRAFALLNSNTIKDACKSGYAPT